MSELEYTTDDGVATILLNRPEKRNAFTLTMIDAWREALIDVRDDPSVRVLVLRGQGDAFCAGVDLGRVDAEMGANAFEFKELLRLRIQPIPLLMEDIDKPTIASISGPAVGAGLDMALMCDIRLMASSARLCESYIRVGFVPGAGGCYFLPRIVGLAKAYEMFITGDFVHAEEAYRIGLVNHVYADDRLLEETYDLASRLAKNSEISAGIIKRTLYQSERCDLRTALDLVSSHMGVVRSTQSSRAAFVDARTAVTGDVEGMP